MRAPTRRQANLAGFLVCALMMSFAYFEQYVVGLEPCNMCILQRFAVLALGAGFLLAAAHDPGRAGARVYAVLIATLAGVGIAFAGRHVWMQAQPAGSLRSCGADFATMLAMMPVTEVVATIWTGGADCQEIDWQFLGLSMPAWLLVALLALAAFGLWANLRLQHARGG